MPRRFLVEIVCNGCLGAFTAEKGSLFTSTSEAEDQAFRAGWEKTAFHGIEVYACPTCQESALKAASA